MPLVEIKVFEEELSERQAEELITKITDAIVDVTSEQLRGATWVVVGEVKDGHWGVGGQALRLDDVKRLMARDPTPSAE